MILICYRKSIALAMCAMAQLAGAQGQLEAIQNFAGNGGSPGYVNKGIVGWSFTPTQDIFVTSLGCVCTSSQTSPFTADLWDANGNVISSSMFSENITVTEAGNTVHYQTVSPVELVAGMNYAVGGSVPPNNQLQFFEAINPTAASQIQITGYSFNINQGGATFLSSFTTATPGNVFTPAATFEFQPVPEPSGSILISLGCSVYLGLFLIRRKRAP